jgi:hypothetical protein
MKSPQKVTFKDIEAFLAYLPESELRIVNLLRRIIIDCIPDCQEKLAYNVLFFYRRSRICYVWPGSIPWGGFKEGVAIGFCRGSELIDEGDYFDKRGKGIALKVFFKDRRGQC